MMHVDEFIDNPMRREDGQAYARWFFSLHRYPAILQGQFHEWMAPFKLFCTWKGARYRVTGASRLGDVWLTSNFERDCGYEHRVDLDECSNWSPQP